MKGEEGAAAGSASLPGLLLGDKSWPGAGAFWGRREGEAGRTDDFAAKGGAEEGVWGRGGILWLFADSGLKGSLLLAVVVVVMVVVLLLIYLRHVSSEEEEGGLLEGW